MNNSSNLWIGNLNRDESGQFAPKGQDKKPMRSMRISENDWEALGLKASEQGKSRTELIEELAQGKIDEQAIILKALKAFVARQASEYGSNNAQKGKQFSKNSRSWDYLNKFANLIENEPWELGIGE